MDQLHRTNSSKYSSFRAAAPLETPPGHSNNDPRFFSALNTGANPAEQRHYQIGLPQQSPQTEQYDQYSLKDPNQEAEAAAKR